MSPSAKAMPKVANFKLQGLSIVKVLLILYHIFSFYAIRLLIQATAGLDFGLCVVI